LAVPHFKLEPEAKLSAKWTPKNYLMYHSSEGSGRDSFRSDGGESFHVTIFSRGASVCEGDGDAGPGFVDEEAAQGTRGADRGAALLQTPDRANCVDSAGGDAVVGGSSPGGGDSKARKSPSVSTPDLVTPPSRGGSGSGEGAGSAGHEARGRAQPSLHERKRSSKIASYERGERFLFWPMGIASPGAMRQAGTQATAFIGRRHFDDADLVEKRFRLRY
jgi:hypothetical protein